MREARGGSESQPAPGPSRRELVVGSSLLALYLPASLAYAFWRHLDHNEHMYAAAAAMRSSLTPYRDFCWIQAPGWMELESLAFGLSGGRHLLLTGRLLNWALACLGLLIFHRLARRVAGPWPGLALVVILASSRHFLVPLAESSNYALAFAAGMGAAASLLEALKKEPAAWPFLSGLLLALAGSTKLYYLAAWPAFVLVALLHPKEFTPGERVRRILLPGAVGLTIGLIPFAILVLTEPEAAWFGNVRYHLLNEFALREGGIPFTDSLQRLAWMAGMPETAAILLFLLAALVAACGLPVLRGRADLLLFATLAPLALAAALSPRPIYVQYFLYPLPFLLLSAGCVLGASGGRRRLLLLAMGAPALLLALGLTGPPLLAGLARFARSAPTVPAQVERVAADLAERVGAREGTVATLSPLYALEAGLPIEPELVTGPFAHRMARLLEPEERRRFVLVSGPEIADFLARRAPAAVLVGEEGALDEPFRAFALAAGYAREPLAGGGLEVYLRPAGFVHDGMHP